MRAVFQSLKANGAPRWSEGDFPPRPTKKKEETTLETLGKLAALGESVAFKVDCVPKRNETKKKRKKERKKKERTGRGRRGPRSSRRSGALGQWTGSSSARRRHKGSVPERTGWERVCFVCFFFATAAIVRPCAACDSENERWPAVVTHFSEAKVGALEQQEAGRLVGRNPCVKNSCFSTWRQRPSVSRR